MVYGRLAPGEENSGKLVSKVREKAKQIAKESGVEQIIIDGAGYWMLGNQCHHGC